MDAGRSSQLGKYQLVAEIARGGMGIVFLAIATGPARFSKLLVVKELKPELSEDPAFTEMFLEEARLAARLNHPNIVQTYEIGVDDDRQYMVMDYLEGVTLARLLRKQAADFTLGLHLRVICELLEGLQYAHELKDFDGSPLGIVHRDVSPQNVFITYDGTAKLVDFGIAKAFDSAVETRTGMLKGKPSYMAPEQLQGQVDPRADLYSVGVMLWEAAAGRRMWHKRSDIEVLASLVNGAVPSLKEAAPHVDDELLRITTRALARDRDERYQTARELSADIEAYLKASSQVVSMREVAQVPSRIFASERASARAAIESHLQRVKTGQVSDKIPSIRPPPLDGTTPSHRLTGDAGESSVGSLGSIGSLGSSPSRPSRRYSGTPASASQRTPPAMADIPIDDDFRSGSRQRRSLVIGIFFGALAVAIIMFLVSSRRPSVALQQSVASSSPAQVDPPTSASAMTSPPPATMLDAATTAEAMSAVDAAAPSTVPEKRLGERARWTAPPRAPKEKDREPPSPAPETSNNETATSAPGSGSGYLTLDTFPWTHVSMGGRSLGDTPLVRVALPAGTHTLSLDNPDENVHKTTVVTVKGGEAISRRLAF